MPGSRIEKAVSDAELLVEFAARNGIDVDGALVNIVTATRTAVDAGNVSAAQEAAFFEAYIKLAHALGKVTVSSIRDSRDEFGIERQKYIWFGPKVQISCAQIAVKRFRRRAIAALVFLLIAQIYWLWGSTLTDNLRQIETRDSELKKVNIATATDVEAQAVTTEQSNLYIRFTVLDSLLRDWSALWGLLGNNQNPNYKDVPSVYPNHLMLRVPAENRLVVFQVYVLPLLYGLVGACAYVLRQLIIETRERTYQEEARPAYDLRIFLGMLAGLAVGWFLRPDSQGKMIGQLTPFALSFLAGYSVEVLFSAMDKLVNTFGSVSQTSKG